ncbi:MAG: HAD family hydrolase [Candidatus Aenigmatarchaeota archaeon]
MIRALIFDVNGTLDTMQEERIRALREVVGKLKPSLSDKGNRKTAEELLVAVEREDVKNASRPMKDIVRDALQDTFKESELEGHDLEELYELYSEARKKYESIDETFLNIIEDLKEKYKIFVLSQAGGEYIDRMLEEYDIHEVFDGIYNTREFKRKPNIEIYEKILEENDLKAGECVMIGDDSLLDLFPAKIAGLKTLLFSRYVDGAVSDYGDFKEIIEEM